MRQKRLFFILLAILALSILYALWATPRTGRQEDAAPTGLSAPLSGSAEPLPVSDWERLHIDLLQPSNREYPGFKRDIFGPLFEPPRQVRKPSPPKEVAEPVAPGPEPPAVSQEEVRDALAHFTFLGFLEKGDDRTVFLASGDDIFLVKEGDRFGEDDRFIVLDITTEELSIRQGGVQRLITIPLVEQAPLIPSF